MSTVHLDLSITKRLAIVLFQEGGGGGGRGGHIRGEKAEITFKSILHKYIYMYIMIYFDG